MVVPPVAGWYHDPTKAGALRWWDGTDWTGHVVNETPSFANLASAVPLFEQVGDGGVCVLRLRWSRTTQAQSRLLRLPVGTSSWELRISDHLFARFTSWGFVAEGSAAQTHWRIVHRPRYSAVDCIEDRRTGREVGTIDVRPYGYRRYGPMTPYSALVKFETGRAFVWSEIKSKVQRGWQFRLPDDSFTVKLLDPELTYSHLPFAWYVALRRAGAFDVEVRWRGPLPAETTMLCCLGLRLRLLPFNARGGGGGA